MIAYWIHVSLVVFALTAPASDEVKELPGYGTPPTRQYSGFLNATTPQADEPGTMLHYWFVEAETDPSEKPVVLWLNGGPGSSSILGMLQEWGPLLMGAKGDLVANPYAWTKHANMILLESPAGVGYSYCDKMLKGGACSNTDSGTAAASRAAMQDFFKTKMPELRKNKFYITGESYAGVYVPTLAAEILDHATEINIQGIAVGDPCTDNAAQRTSMEMLWYSHKHGLLPDAEFDFLWHNCSFRHAPWLNEGELVSRSGKLEAVHELQTPSHKNATPACIAAHRRYLAATSKGISQVWSKAWMNDLTLFGPSAVVPFTQPGSLNYMCATWMMRDDVRKALNVDSAPQKSWPGPSEGWSYKKQWAACNSQAEWGQWSMVNFYRNIAPKLTTTIVFNGDTDPCVSYEGTRTAIERVGFQQIPGGWYRPWFFDHAAAPVTIMQQKPLLFGPDLSLTDAGAQFGGHVVNYEHNLSFITVHGSGHMVPQFRPQAAERLLQVLLSGESFAPLAADNATLGNMSDSDFDKYLDDFIVRAKNAPSKVLKQPPSIPANVETPSLLANAAPTIAASDSRILRGSGNSHVSATGSASDEVTELPGYGPPPTRQYSGFLNASHPDADEPGTMLHYWFVEAEADPSEKPVVLWLNGGPGSSSILGMLQEWGPLLMGAKGDLVANPYAWTTHANMILLESPAGVGFSYCDKMLKGGACSNTDKGTAAAARAAMQDFFKTKMPQLRKNKFYITGESYAGVYVPTLAAEILENATEINIHGVAVGDPCTDNAAQNTSMDMLWYSNKQGFLPDAEFDFLWNNCSFRHAPWLKSGEWVSRGGKLEAVRGLQTTSFEKDTPACKAAQRRYLAATSKGISQSWSKAWINDLSLFGPAAVVPFTQPGSLNYACATWMMRDDVRKALHVESAPQKSWPGPTEGWSYKSQWAACNAQAPEGTWSMIDFYRMIAPKLTTTIVFNGDTDPCVSYEGTRTAIERVGFPQIAGGWYRPWFFDHAAAPVTIMQQKPLLFGPDLSLADAGKQFGGHVVNYEHNLSFITVHGSGHMVPQFRPQAAERLLQVLLSGESFAPLIADNASLANMSDDSFDQYLDEWIEKDKQHVPITPRPSSSSGSVPVVLVVCIAIVVAVGLAVLGYCLKGRRGQEARDANLMAPQVSLQAQS